MSNARNKDKDNATLSLNQRLFFSVKIYQIFIAAGSSWAEWSDNCQIDP